MLSQRQRVFLHALRSRWADNDLTIEDIAASAGLQRHRAATYWSALQGVQLIFDDGDLWQLHPGLAGVQVLGPSPRRTSTGRPIQAVTRPIPARQPASPTTPATAKQVDYISSLLSKNGASLSDFYPVTEPHLLTRRDAQYLIDGLTADDPWSVDRWAPRWAAHFEETSVVDRTVFPVVCRLMPEIRHLSNSIAGMAHEDMFCDRDAWYGQAGSGSGIRSRLASALGPNSRVTDGGFREIAFEVSFRSLARSLPRCRVHAEHTHRLADVLAEKTA